MAGAGPEHMPDRLRTGVSHERHVDAQEVFRGEGQDRANLISSHRSEALTVPEQDSKSDLGALRAAQRTRTVPSLACVRVCAAQDGGVCRGDADSGRFTRGVEHRAEEWSRRPERIDVYEIVPPFTYIRGQIARVDIRGQFVSAKVLADQPRRLLRPIVEREMAHTGFEGHSNAPCTRGREAVEDGPERTRPLPEDDRTKVAVHRHRRIVERPRTRGPGALAARDVRDQEVRGALRDRGDMERKLHGRRDGGGAQYPFVR